MTDKKSDPPRAKAHSLQVGAYVVLCFGIVTCAALGALELLSEDNVVRGVFGSLAVMVYLLSRNGTPPKLMTTIGVSAAAGETAPALLDVLKHLGAGIVLAVTLGGCSLFQSEPTVRALKPVLMQVAERVANRGLDLAELPAECAWEQDVTDPDVLLVMCEVDTGGKR